MSSRRQNLIEGRRYGKEWMRLLIMDHKRIKNHRKWNHKTYKKLLIVTL